MKLSHLYMKNHHSVLVYSLGILLQITSSRCPCTSSCINHFDIVGHSHSCIRAQELKVNVIPNAFHSRGGWPLFERRERPKGTGKSRPSELEHRGKLRFLGYNYC